jgi:hypothetical protein
MNTDEHVSKRREVPETKFAKEEVSFWRESTMIFGGRNILTRPKELYLHVVNSWRETYDIE